MRNVVKFSILVLVTILAVLVFTELNQPAQSAVSEYFLHQSAGYARGSLADAVNWDTAYTNRITSATAPLDITSYVISIPVATTDVSGYISQTDWDIFNDHAADSSQAHSDYLLNTGDIATGDYNFGSGLFFIDDTNNKVGIETTSPDAKLQVVGDCMFGDDVNDLLISSKGQLTLAGDARVIRHLHFVPELGRGQSAPTIRYTEDPYVSYTYAIGDDSHMTREVPQDMDYTVESIIKIHWYTTDVDANGVDEVRWEAQWASRAPGEDITAGDTTGNSGDIVCSAVNIIIETIIETIPADSIVEGDMLGIHIERVILGDGTNPTAGTVHVLDVELEYTSNKLGLAL